MIDLVLPYVLGFLVSQGISTIWFFSGLPIHIFKSLRLIKKDEDIFTNQEWEVWITEKSDFFGELLTCPVCLSFWISLAVSSTMSYLSGHEVWFIVSAVLSWPFLMFLSYKLLNK